MNKTKKEIKSLAKSFKYAFDGILFCIKRERNMRIHISVIPLVLFFSFAINLDICSWLFVFSAIFFVIFAEMMNTAIEYIVAKISQGFDYLSKIAKDIAAGAVLVSSIYAVVVAVLVFVFSGKINEIFCLLQANPILCFAVLFYVCAAIIFIFFMPSTSFIKNKKSQKSRK